jgi:mono/diheme cytochrome c family protein
MFKRKTRASTIVLCGAVLGAWALWGAATPKEKIERGRYLVERASMCIDCHSPMTPKGEPDMTREMQGAPIAFKPAVKVPEWADTAPALAGLVGYTEAQIVTALTTHIGPKGTRLRPPMPPYRLTKEDAEAVAAFLRTLKPAKPAVAMR